MLRSLVSASLIAAVCGISFPSTDANAAEPFTPSDKADYWIKECTKWEYVSVGAENNVLRWERARANSPTKGREQLWTFKPREGSLYSIMSKKNNEPISIVAFGNARLWQFNPDDKAQKFRLWKLSPEEARRMVPGKYYERNQAPGTTFVMIQEQTKDEFLSVGSNGNILRWARANDRTQVFALIPITR